MWDCVGLCGIAISPVKLRGRCTSSINRYFSVTGFGKNNVIILMFRSVLLRPGFDGIASFPMMTVKTPTDSEGKADPHATPQLLTLAGDTCTLMQVQTHTVRREDCVFLVFFLQVLWDSGILDGVFVCVFCFTTLLML